MVRNRGCENSDGCCAAVLERMVVDPGARQKGARAGTLLPWFRKENLPDPAPVEAGSGSISDGQEAYPSFRVGGWTFTVKTRDLQLIGDLKSYIDDISHSPRADAMFTGRLVRCTEQGRLGGWAWQKERAQVS